MSHRQVYQYIAILVNALHSKKQILKLQILSGSILQPGDTTGYLAVDRTNKLIVLSFRGTVSNENGQTDLEFQQVDASRLCSGCYAHKGFWEASLGAFDIINPALKAAKTKYPSFELIVTGHSLGGALATLEAAHLKAEGHHLDMYTFGAPSVGNKALAEFITSQGSGQKYRVTHTDDEVPKVLYQASRTVLLDVIVPEYSQSSPEYWITSDDGVYPTTSDIQVIHGVDNTTGNLGQPGFDLTAHGWYMINTTACQQT
ncbi:hypothetical protein N7510_002945 [Penicillium lagena]|uniref:uncharacterized protein n=1 Tax=Penicillium lagena TaxID=94218 RepID=UPI0025410CFF|nr:uncharacterized protein N7510_002945 [Penicillium lagena]KAJ5618961.1 hypothetical protein N7510_002945 [Penicillium lagena]